MGDGFGRDEQREWNRIMDRIPYEIIEAMIQCFGLSFHYKDTMEIFLVSAGVEKELARKYRDDPKFVWAKRLISELNQTDKGVLVLRRTLTELYRLRNLPDKDVPDRNAGLSALRKLKKLVIKYNLDTKEAKRDDNIRVRLSEEKSKVIFERARKLEELHRTFLASFSNPNRQQAGYSLEDLLKDLFAVFEVEYRKSYRTNTQQIDGHFRFEGFDYLVEAKWRKDLPTEQEVAGFRQKVITKLESTRGFFVSVNGFREEVVNQFSGQGANIIFMSGEDLIHILEGRIDLRDALRTKVEKASQEGKVYVPISKIMSGT